MEFEFKNSLDPDKSESTLPELKLLNDGRAKPESGASVVDGTEDDDDDDDEDDDGENALRKESGIIEPNPLLPLLPLSLLPFMPLLPLLPLNMIILYYYVYFNFYNILILLIL